MGPPSRPPGPQDSVPLSAATARQERRRDIQCSARETSTIKNTIIIDAFVAVLPAAARQGVALKDLTPKGLVIGVAIDQRQFDGTNTAAVDIIKHTNPISPENVLNSNRCSRRPTATRSTRPVGYGQFGLDRQMRVVGHNLVWH